MWIHRSRVTENRLSVLARGRSAGRRRNPRHAESVRAQPGTRPRRETRPATRRLTRDRPIEVRPGPAGEADRAVRAHRRTDATKRTGNEKQRSSHDTSARRDEVGGPHGAAVPPRLPARCSAQGRMTDREPDEAARSSASSAASRLRLEPDALRRRSLPPRPDLDTPSRPRSPGTVSAPRPPRDASLARDDRLVEAPTRRPPTTVLSLAPLRVPAYPHAADRATSPRTPGRPSSWLGRSRTRSVATSPPASPRPTPTASP